MTNKLVRFSVTVPENLLSEFEESYHPRINRSDAVRNLMREYISRESFLKKSETREIFATITITYDHHIPELTGKLTAAQHDSGDIIICSTHVHINHETCLECVITKGLSDDIKKFIEALKNIRGIKSLNVNISID